MWIIWNGVKLHPFLTRSSVIHISIQAQVPVGKFQVRVLFRNVE